MRICSQDVFGFAEHQKHVAYGLGYKLKMKKLNDRNILMRPLVGKENSAKTSIHT